MTTNDTIITPDLRYTRATPDGLPLEMAPGYYRKMLRLPDDTPITIERRNAEPPRQLVGSTYTEEV